MLPEFLFSVGNNSMQELSRDDFQLLNGAGTGNTCSDKDMCPTLQRINPSPLLVASDRHGNSIEVSSQSGFDESPTLNGIKLEDTSPVDLFPTHATTWQQHPMNTHEHAHHRLHPHQQQQHPHLRFNGGNSSNKLLLQSSDDPLICRGASDDDNPAEFKSLIAAANNGREQCLNAPAAAITVPAPQPAVAAAPPPAPKRVQNGCCSSLTKQQLKVKAGLMSAQHQQQHNQAVAVAAATNTSKPRTPKAKKKGAIKLRFHHQALPPEYLSHYEATQGQLSARPPPSKELPPREAPHTVKIAQTAKLPPPKSAHENVRSWLQKIAEIQRTAQQQQQPQALPLPPLQQPCTSTVQLPHDANNNNELGHMPSVIAPLTADRLAPKVPPAATLPTVVSLHATDAVKHQPLTAPHAPSKRVIKYADLPYMGEITLDNSKPRRGRKPKKTDICHLIYKNYGTIFPGTPKEMLNERAAGVTAKLKLEAHRALEEQPLNLCLRDQSSELYSVSSGEDEDDDALASNSSSHSHTPVASAADVATDTLLAANLKVAMPSLQQSTHLLQPDPQQPPLPAQVKLEPRTQAAKSAAASLKNANNAAQLHSVSLYYQKLIESGTLMQPNGSARVFGLPVETIQKDNQLALKIPIPSGLLLTPKLEKCCPPTPTTQILDYPEPMSTPSSIKSEHSIATTATTLSSALTAQQVPPQKRKRSAIFIPPMPAEHTSNPATEVSICKFKFTGGAKPTLQEKKMLYVDADGNYRYYSGTGDKSMRGYEFFPRETLQQSGLLPGVNCTGAFMQATGEKILLDIPPPSAELSNDLLQIPDSPNLTLLLPAAASPQMPHTPLSPACSSSPAPAQLSTATTGLHSINQSGSPHSPMPPIYTNGFQAVAASTACTSTATTVARAGSERKKKTRRCSQREKLEKTFKEKGFLIQTQQLESAEGATYCKFRQLKKFTRYLFRNWKDYLPDELQQANAAAAAAAAALNSAQAEGGQHSAATGQQAVIDSLLASHGFGAGNLARTTAGGSCTAAATASAQERGS